MGRWLIVFLVALPALEAANQGYAGSAACRTCHPALYARWQKTRMANVVVDPKVHPEAVLGDFSKPNPLVKFKIDDVAFVYGSKWKQRYFTKTGDDYFVQPAQWDIRNHVWRPYGAQPGTDWWVAHYPADPKQRLTGALCDGCHSVNYDPVTKQVTEWNVGCEKCHGPGLAHAQHPARTNIVNPASLNTERAGDVCMQCHSQGQPQANPIAGKYFDWPVGYTAGAALRDVWKLEEHKLGETSFTHFPDGSAHKNRMQSNDFVTSRMYARGVACFSCHDVHGTDYAADLIRPGNELCLQCHGPHSPNGFSGTLAEHTHHAANSAGSQCTGCHMPEIAQTIGDVKVHSHTFRFITPTASEQDKIPNPCLICHKDKSTAWAALELSKWSNFSDWRF